MGNVTVKEINEKLSIKLRCIGKLEEKCERKNID